MKKMFVILAAAAVVAVLASCSTVRGTNNFNGQGMTTVSSAPIAHVNARISGIYLFWFMPLWSGSPKENGDFEFFSNNVDVKNTVGLLTNYSKTKGATHVVDLQSRWEVKDFWIMPPFMICIKECQVSGTCVKLK